MQYLARLLAASLCLSAPEARAGIADAPPHAVPRTHQVEMASASGAAYRIMVAVPASPPPAAGYPVIYALDGNAVFATLAELIRRVELGGPGNGSAALVVAVGYPTSAPYDIPRRALDYTPAAPPAEPERRPEGTLYPRPPHGGADRFLDFLERELKPAVARDFPVDPARQALLGHSYGGLLALHALFTRPSAFDVYVAASPSLWWNGGWIGEEEAAFRARAAAAPVAARLVLSVGEFEQELTPLERRLIPTDKLEARSRHLRRRAMVDAVAGLAGRLRDVAGLAVDFRVHEGETHISVLPIAYTRALPLLWGD